MIFRMVLASITNSIILFAYVLCSIHCVELNIQSGYMCWSSHFLLSIADRYRSISDRIGPFLISCHCKKKCHQYRAVGAFSTRRGSRYRLARTNWSSIQYRFLGPVLNTTHTTQKIENERSCEDSNPQPLASHVASLTTHICITCDLMRDALY